MKKEQRWAYLGLSYVPLPGGGSPCICSFCKYAEWEGGCCGEFRECTHPLFDHGGLWEWAESAPEGYGNDCWGFRPAVDIPTADGMVQNWIKGKDVIWEGVSHD